MIEDDRINNIIRFTLNKFGITAKYCFIKLTHQEYVSFFKGVTLTEYLVLEFMNYNFGPEGLKDCLEDYRREHGKTSNELSKKIEKIPATIVTKDNFFYLPQTIKEIILNEKLEGTEIYVDILKSLINSDEEYLIVLDEEILLKYPDKTLVEAICHETLHIIEDAFEVDNMASKCELVAEEYLEFEKNNRNVS
jgi:hypothetical protein